MSDVSAYVAHGLYDESRHDDDRLELLDYLTSQGITPDQIAAAERDGRLASLLTDRIAGAPRYSLLDVATAAGQSPEPIANVWRAAGFPDPKGGAIIFTESDAEAMTTFSLGVDIFGEDATLQLVRVIGSSLSRIAEAQLSTAMANVEGAFFATAPSPLEAMRKSAELLSILPIAEKAIGHLLRRHLITANRRFEQMRSYGTSPEVRDIAVGFGDLSGSTKLSGELSWTEFADMMREFEALTSDIVASGGGHVVKLIGDEVMFVAPGAHEICLISLDLIDGCDAHPVLPRLRVGLGIGPVVTRDGDYFGEVVHMASRLVDLAVPGSIAVPETIAAEAASFGLVSKAVGDQVLKGFQQPRSVYRLSRKP